MWLSAEMPNLAPATGGGEVSAQQTERGCWQLNPLPAPPLRHGLRPRHLSPNCIGGEEEMTRRQINLYTDDFRFSLCRASQRDGPAIGTR